MRIFTIDVTPILPMLSTAKKGFAMWVNVPQSDFPQEITVHQKSHQVVSVKLVYEEVHNVYMRKVSDDVHLYLTKGRNLIAGFDLPVRNFRQELRNVIGWLGEEGKQSNVENTRMNWRVVSSILHMEADNLFFPPQ